MLITIIIVFLLASACTIVGQALFALAHIERDSWLAPPCGFALLLSLAAGTVHLPGRATTTLIAVVLLCIVAAFVNTRLHSWTLPQDASIVGSAAALSTALMCIPFAVNGRFGLIGQSVGDDLGSHYAVVASLQQGFGVPLPLRSGGYPIGLHSLVAAVSTAIGDINQAFTALMILIVALTAGLAAGLLRDQSPIRRILAATLVGLPYLTAAFYAQNAFKEMGDGLFVLAIAAGLALATTRARIPSVALAIGVLTAGAVQITGYPAIAWAVGGVVAWGVLVLASERLRPAPSSVRLTAQHLTWGVVGLVIPLMASLPRIVKFNPVGAATNGDPHFLGYYFHNISVFEALGVWPIGDFRYFPSLVNTFDMGVLMGAVAVLFLACMVWWLRDRRLLAIPAVAISAAIIYAYARHTQGPYLNAKPLAAMAPLLMLILVKPMMNLVRRRPRLTTDGLAARALLVVFLCAAGYSTLDVLASARVGPLEYASDLMRLRPLVRGHATLFLPEDHYVNWELAGARLSYPSVWSILSEVPVTPRKASVGIPVDFDSIDPAVLNKVEYVVGARTAVQSEPPTNFHLVAETRWYELFRRTGPTPSRKILEPAGQPGATLDCHTAAGAKLARTPGIAAVRRPPTYGGGWTVAPPGTPAIVAMSGQAYVQHIMLPPGEEEISLQYQSQVPMTLSLSSGQSYQVPAYLGAYGSIWRVGDANTSGGSITVTVTPHRPPSEIVGRTEVLGQVAATPPNIHDKLIPLNKACGDYVDWYQPSGGASRSSS